MSSDLPDPDSNQDSAWTTSDVAEHSTLDREIDNPARGDNRRIEVGHSLADVSANGLSYLHPTSLMFDLLAHGRTYLVPAAFGLWGAAKGDATLLIISAMIFVPAFLVSVFRYFTFRYCITNGQLIVRQGLIFRHVRTVPVSRIQNIDFVQNLLHRIFQVAEVKVETASGTKPEATLRVLSMSKMESLRDAVFGDSASNQTLVPDADWQTDPIQTEVPHSAIQPMANPANGRYPNASGQSPLVTPLLEIPLSWLIKAGMASNRGMIMVGILLGAYFQFVDQKEFFRFEALGHLLPVNASPTFIAVAAIGGVIGALLLLRLLGVGWFVLRFFGYQLVRRGDDLRISCGLLTKVSATVPRQRVQFISVHRNLFMRMFGLASIRIETAGGAGNQGEHATESVSKRWFIPVVPEQRVAELLTALRPDLEWDESKLDFKPLSERTGRRLCRLAFMEAVMLSAVGMLVSRPWGWTVGVVALPLLVMWAIKKSKAMRYARAKNCVVYRSGVFIRKTSVTFFEKIQTLRVDQTPFDRRWKMARLSIDTAAAGPADHRIQVPYLEENFARKELQLLRLKTAQEQPVFG